jgi:hypothetical protein
VFSFGDHLSSVTIHRRKTYTSVFFAAARHYPRNAYDSYKSDEYIDSSLQNRVGNSYCDFFDGLAVVNVSCEREKHGFQRMVNWNLSIPERSNFILNQQQILKKNRIWIGLSPPNISEKR